MNSLSPISAPLISDHEIFRAFLNSSAHSLCEALFDAFYEYNDARRRTHTSGILRPRGEFSPSSLQRISDAFWSLHSELNDFYDDQNHLPEYKQQYGKFLVKQLLPWMLLSYSVKRVLQRPEGFIGDHHTIEMMYQGCVDEVHDIHPLGRIIDNLFLAMPSCQAVRDRRKTLAGEIRRCLELRSETLHVTSVGSGSAREIYDVFRTLDNPKKLFVTLIDVDIRALSKARDSLDALPGVRKQVQIREFDVKKMNFLCKQDEAQDLIYSAGLMDYFDDETFIKYLRHCDDGLNAHGKIVVGNYSARNSTKGVMRYLLNWELYFRDELLLKNLLNQSGITFKESDFLYDETHRIQPFLRVQK